ncbi:tetratricopeptide repeat protein [Thiocystis violacea]|uniref:tetratricopeptide repeat protein n=1 Tax=Thiocystis violacea TaxID=13725 RepID=UPI001903F6B8|nr:tetratricopeptide repeat protein [Thiocystis violacea]MBK1722282.1 aspartate phosphatase [Thiocystis violacea]
MIVSRALDVTSRPVLTPGLRRVLAVVFVLLGLLAVNSLYLLAVTLGELGTGRILQNRAYLLMFLAHLALGLVAMLPVLTFAVLHLRRAWYRPNRYAVRAGLGLLLSLVLLFASGVLLTRFGFFEINAPSLRRWAYWIHVLTPLTAIWFFVLHRLAGPRLNWRPGLVWAAAGVGVVAVALTLHLRAGLQTPELAQAFAPALTELPAGRLIAPEHLMQDDLCAECHADIAKAHASGVHAMSSFDNPAYRASIDELRAQLLARDGDVKAARLCATCHDQVPLFSGRFDRVDFDPNQDPTAGAGITCLGCHAITAVASPLGNGGYRLEDPPGYPFAFSDQPLLKGINRQLIKAKPAFHKETLLKPIHARAEFCSACHKVHLPFALNRYRWLRGQNHYDSFLMSGVSGHRVDSFYYPAKAVGSCNVCHMPPQPSTDPAARDLGGDGQLAVHGHSFAAANTAVPGMLGRAEPGNTERERMLRQAARIDLFGLKEEGRIDGALHAPLRPDLPTLEPGRRYLLELVVRTLGVGHELTQGTVDSNELWLDVEVRSGDRVIGRSGMLDARGEVDDWAYFVNAYLLDRDGNRIERRNAQDIVVALYDHQIPPGAAAVAHYAFTLPADLEGPVKIYAALRYRKFDSRFMRFVEGDGYAGNRLPIVTMAEDALTLPVRGLAQVARQSSAIPPWERWNDYGIGLLREGKRGESRQAADAFAQVEELGHAEGPLNLARVLYREGRLEEAGAALARAAACEPAAPPWTLAWLTALIERDLGQLDAAIASLQALAETRFNDARQRGFDFSRDYRMLTELGRTLYERARQERGQARLEARMALLARARDWLERALIEDPENAATHHNLSLVLAELGERARADEHRRLHEVYRIDDNAVERAVSLHRSRVPAADHAAEAVAIYDLQRFEGSAGVAEWPSNRKAIASDAESSTQRRMP